MAKTVIPNRPVPELDPVNDARHVLADEPLARESVPYVFCIPEHKIAALVYTWVNKASQAGAVFAAFGPGVGDQPIVEHIPDREVPASQNFDDWRVGSFYLRQDLKLKNAEFGIDTPRAGLQCRFEALHPAYAYGFHPDGCPRWAAHNRLEQAGRISGTLRLGDRTITFSTTGARDHSWGTRDWLTPQHWKWLHAQADGVCVHAWQINAYGRTDLRGYVFREGRMAEITEVDTDFKVDAQYRQTHIDSLVTDSAGRTTRVTGEYFAVFPLLPGPQTTLNEGAMECRIDGKPGVGWTEFQWPTDYLKHLTSTAP
ncbi:MAG: hypothetical protein ISP90_12445 [Nevskia sp.]|nr:hypothetical protein [Nevskia sp.]